MSSIKLESNVSGTGIFTIASPNSNTNRTLTLPDATGTIITTAGGAAISGTTGAFTTTVGVGGATPAASGAGITFPATQSASSDANTLDDYEEGTWTPADGSGAGLSFSSVSATYEKIGRTVIARFALTYPSTANGSSTSISGLPFTTANSQDSRQGFITICNESTVSRPIPNANSTTIVLINSSGANISNATMSTKLVYATLIYQV